MVVDYVNDDQSTVEAVLETAHSGGLPFDLANAGSRMVENALAYSRLGWPIFPLHEVWGDDYSAEMHCSCERNCSRKKMGKHPRTERGFHDARTDEIQIREWWTHWPTANIGISTGPSQLVVIDIDPEHRGDESFEILQSQHDIPDTLTAKTGSGGRHLYFLAPEGGAIRGFAGTKLGEGIDIRAEGGYVVAPPSRNAEGKYEWINVRSLAHLPASLITILRGPNIRLVNTSTGGHEASDNANIADGHRNTALTSEAGVLRRRGWDEDAMYAALSVFNQKHCYPPLDDSEVRDVARNVAKYPAGVTPFPKGNAVGSQQSAPPPSHKDILLELAAEAELFHTSDNKPFARVPRNGHSEVYSISDKGGGFRGWLMNRFITTTDNVPNTNAVKEVVDGLAARAVYGGTPVCEAHIRVACHNGNIYLDLANDQWQVVEIRPDGWTVLGESPVMFRRGGGQSALPIPQHGGNLNLLRQFLPNVGDTDWMLVASFLVSTLNPEGPYAILALHGERGAGKSTTTRFIRTVIDPARTVTRDAPKDAKALAVAARHSWLPAFDNLSRLPAWLSDALCRLSTGGGFGDRTLYENDGETTFYDKRPVIINGIEELATRGDLLDRCIVVNLPRMEGTQRRAEAEIEADFRDSHPIILGGVLDTVSHVLRTLPTTKIDDAPRMVDFAMWGCAAAEALGWTQDNFLTAYRGNRDDAITVELDASPLVDALRELLAQQKGGQWRGTMHELHLQLHGFAGDAARLPSWPKDAARLGGELRRLAPSLKARHVAVEMWKSAGKRWVSITRHDRDGEGQ